MPKQCSKHNLPEQVICVGQQCPKRIGCQLCLDKHDHKFYLDTKLKQKPLQLVQQQLDQKLIHLQKYTKSNILNLKLEKYRQKIERLFQEQRIYFKNKVDEEMINISLWFQKISKYFQQLVQNLKGQCIKNWAKYNNQAMGFMKQIQQYDELKQYFKEGDWSTHAHVDKSVGLLYSEQLFFRFNRNLDALKKQINHHKKEDGVMLEWFENRRQQFLKFQICPHQKLQNMLDNYANSPKLSTFIQSKTKQLKDDRDSLLNFICQQQKATLLYPQTVYQPFHSIYKLIRYDNQIFVTSGARAVNVWTRVSVQPQKSYPLNFPSYGLLSFVQYGKDEPEQVIYGKSNGEMGVINISNQNVKQMPAHQSAIRDILQLDSYHFLTASQDWTMKLWGMNDSKQKYFASERLTLTGHSGRIYTLCKFGPNVLAAGNDGSIKLWDIMRQSFDQVFAQQKQIYALTQIRPELFASGGQEKQLRVWDYRKTKSHVASFPVQFTCNSILRYDDNRIIFNDKHIIKMIDIRSFKEPIQLMSQTSTFTYTVNSMTYLSDNQIGIGGSDSMVSIWKY